MACLCPSAAFFEATAETWNVAEAPAARVIEVPVVLNVTPSFAVSVTLTVNVLLTPLMFVITTDAAREPPDPLEMLPKDVLTGASAATASTAASTSTRPAPTIGRRR